MRSTSLRLADVAKLNYVTIVISLPMHFDCPLFQLDVKNTFLHIKLQEDVHMEQPPKYVALSVSKGVQIEESHIKIKANAPSMVS